MIRTVLRMGDPRLLSKSEQVTRFGTVELNELLMDMRDTIEHVLASLLGLLGSRSRLRSGVIRLGFLFSHGLFPVR